MAIVTYAIVQKTMWKSIMIQKLYWSYDYQISDDWCWMSNTEINSQLKYWNITKFVRFGRSNWQKTCFQISSRHLWIYDLAKVKRKDFSWVLFIQYDVEKNFHGLPKMYNDITTSREDEHGLIFWKIEDSIGKIKIVWTRIRMNNHHHLIFYLTTSTTFWW